MFYYKVANYKLGIWKGEGWESRQIRRVYPSYFCYKEF